MHAYPTTHLNGILELKMILAQEQCDGMCRTQTKFVLGEKRERRSPLMQCKQNTEALSFSPSLASDCVWWAKLIHPYQPIGLLVGLVPHYQVSFCLSIKNSGRA